MRRRPFLENQHPQVIYREEPRQSSADRLNTSSVLLNRNTPKKKFSICDLFRKPEGPTTLAQVKPTPQPSVIKLYTTNPISIGTTPQQIMLANPNRLGWRVTNIGTTIIYIGVGKVPSNTIYDHILPGCTGSANDGTGGVLVDDLYLDAVWAVSSASGGSIALVEKP